MTDLTALWLPILLSAVIVFVVSSVIHMATPWHKGDYRRVTGEDKFMDALRPMAIPPGDYMVPMPSGMQEMRSPEFAEKMKRGPRMMFTVFPAGSTGMGAQLALWFVYSLVIAIFAAYVSGRVLAPGAPYIQVFRFAGTTAFLGYSGALWQMTIWYRRNWITTLKSTIDGLLYGLLIAGTLGWLWPR
jgi:hypothetical protein